MSARSAKFDTGVAKGNTPWFIASLTHLLLVSVAVAVAGCSTQQALPPLVNTDIGNCGDTLKAAASPDKGSAPPPVPLREKLGAELLSLVKRYEASSDEGERIARLNGRELVTKSVAVRVSAISEEDVNCLEQQIRDAGGSVESNFENSIFAVVPVEALRALAVSEAVWRVDPQRSLSAPPAPTGPIPEGQQDLKEGGE